MGLKKKIPTQGPHSFCPLSGHRVLLKTKGCSHTMPTIRAVDPKRTKKSKVDKKYKMQNIPNATLQDYKGFGETSSNLYFHLFPLHNNNFEIPALQSPVSLWKVQKFF